MNGRERSRRRGRATIALAILAAAGLAASAAGAAEQERIRRWHWRDPSPKPITPVDPAPYPLYAQLFGIEGWTKVGFQIDSNGEVWGFLIHASAPAGVFEAACLDVVKTLRYEPQYRSDKTYPVSRSWTYTCNYKFAR